MATFGRALQGEADALPGFEQCMVRIGNYEVVTTSGKTYHPNVSTPGQGNRVCGTVFEVSDAELAAADKYETRRVQKSHCRARFGQASLGLSG